MDAYKRLEKLCGELMRDDHGVSAYIKEMENTPKGTFLVSGWQTALKQLKHYKWIRNQIAHNVDCTEENMCSEEDTQWLCDFHARIMNQTDPLAMYRKALQPREPAPIQADEKQNHSDEGENNLLLGCLTAALGIAVLCVIAVLLFS
ncbi:MAG: hypothetical protein J6Q54_01780 [Oscillospiraceae bacterium]|nr:hypothetical protein [Oscillospiraceae bacterium]